MVDLGVCEKRRVLADGAPARLCHPARPRVKLDPSMLDAYVGRYEYTSGTISTFTLCGGTLLARRAGRPEVELVPETEPYFHVPGGGAVYTFNKGEKGRVTHVIVRRADGQDNRENEV